ncbi:MAG: porin family protein [Ferruginibacter sp.]
MKTRLFVALTIFIAITSAAFSQKTVNVGIMAGTDMHKIIGKSFDEEFKFGYHAGAFLEVKVKKIGIQPEVYFSQVNVENGNDSTSFFNINRISKAHLSYLNIPIMLNLYFTKAVALQLGPQFGILVNQNNNGYANAENAFKSGDFSIAGGLSIKISKLRVYGRYVVGLNDKNLKSATDNSKWRSQTIHLGLGYAIL